MRVEELYEFFGTWTALCHGLGVGMNAHQYWRKIGYIPYPTQLVIEKKLKGKFKASLEDAKALPNKE